MKKIITLLFLLLSGIIFSQNFPAQSVNLLLNKIVKPKDLEKTMQQYAYKNFYSKFDTISKKLERYKNESHIFQKGIFQSDYDKLVGKEFKVIKIYEEKTSTESDKKYVLKLQNNDIGDVYYDYDSKYDFDFELDVVGGLQLPDGFYCNDIKITTDKFNGEVTSSSEYSDGISFIKVTKNKISKIYMAINETGETLNVGKKGLVLLLENGKKIERPNTKIDVEAGAKNFVYSAFIELSKEEIALIIKNKITDDRLYIYDGTVENGIKLSEYLKCLTK